MRHVLPIVAALSVSGVSAQAQSGPPASVAPEAMQRWAPSLADDTDTVLFGDVWLHPQLPPRDRSLVTVTVLITTGKTGPLAGHLRRALDNGVTPREVSGLVTHLGWYTGWPNAVAALQVIDEVLQERGIDPAQVRAAGNPLPLPSSDAARARSAEQTVAPVAPRLAELTNERLFADLWRRPELAVRDRSLVTIAALAAGGDADELAFHLTLGEENGLTRDEIAEALTHLAFYAGWPKAMAAIAVLRESDRPQDAPAEPMAIIPPGEKPQQGPAERFTGIVTVTSPFSGSGASRLGGATVSFEAGARTNWHTHTVGQLLVVTAGEGRVQTAGGEVQAIRIGDTVWTAPGVRHWHGAAPDQFMTHVAISESGTDGSVVWGEPVEAAAYNQAPTWRP
jgi:4-carboxymuconolactone decarboxylase